MKEGKVTGRGRIHKGTVKGTGQQKVEALEHLSCSPLANPDLFVDPGQKSYVASLGGGGGSGIGEISKVDISYRHSYPDSKGLAQYNPACSC